MAVTSPAAGMPSAPQIADNETMDSEERPRSTWDRKLIESPHLDDSSPRVHPRRKRSSRMRFPVCAIFYNTTHKFHRSRGPLSTERLSAAEGVSFLRFHLSPFPPAFP